MRCLSSHIQLHHHCEKWDSQSSHIITMLSGAGVPPPSDPGPQRNRKKDLRLPAGLSPN